MKYKHYILTRFNLGIYDNSNPYAEKVGDPDVWMRRRLELFNDYCLPSMKAQTCKDFAWLVAFDPMTRTKDITRIDWGNLEVYWCMTQPHLWLREQQPQTEWIITSRFDNDDMYLPEFVEKIQANFRSVTEIIDIDYQVVRLSDGRTFNSQRTRPNSPFLSLIEPWKENPMTALGRPHTVMSELYQAKKLGILARQIIHENNIMNKIPEL